MWTHSIVSWRMLEEVGQQMQGPNLQLLPPHHHHPPNTSPPIDIHHPPPTTRGGTHAMRGRDTHNTHTTRTSGGGGHMMRLPQGGLSAGMERWKVVMCPCQGSEPASGHPRAQKPPLGRGPPPPAWGVHVGAPGQRLGQLPWTLWSRHRAAKRASSETGTVRGLRRHNLPRERKGGPGRSG